MKLRYHVNTLDVMLPKSSCTIIVTGEIHKNKLIQSKVAFYFCDRQMANQQHTHTSDIVASISLAYRGTNKLSNNGVEMSVTVSSNSNVCADPFLTILLSVYIFIFMKLVCR